MKKTKKNNLSLLFISAHPDDNSLIAGTMKKFSNAKLKVYEFCCANAGSGKSNRNEKNRDDQVKNRKKEVEKFCNLIGCEKPYVFKNEENNFSIEKEMVYELIAYMRKIRPKIIVVLNKDDYHFEHRLAREVGLIAFEIATRSCEENLGPKLTKSIVLETDGLNVLAKPSIFFDISDVQKSKMKIIKSTYGERLGKNLIQFTEALSSLRGARVGIKNAECFNMILTESFRFDSESAGLLKDFIDIGKNKI